MNDAMMDLARVLLEIMSNVGKISSPTVDNYAWVNLFIFLLTACMLPCFVHLYFLWL